MKPGIERLFGTINTSLLHRLPGTTFSNTAKRGDYNSVKTACVSLSEIDKLMNIFIVDVYAQRWHDGLKGIPAHHWQAAVDNGFTPKLPNSSDDLRILLGRVEHRSLQSYGIQFMSLRYNTSELGNLRAELDRTGSNQVKFKYHPADISRIYIYNPFDDSYIETPALAEEYTQNLSVWKHRVVRNIALRERDTVDLVALGMAKRKIQDIVAGSRERKTTGRSKAARWETNGKSAQQLNSEKPATDTTETTTNGEEQQLTTFDLDIEMADVDGWEIGGIGEYRG